MQNIRKVRTLIVVGAAALLTSVSASGASSIAAEDPVAPAPAEVTVVDRTVTQEGDYTVEVDTLSDGSKEAIVSGGISSAQVAARRAAIPCGPTVTDADIERWLTSGSTTDEVKGTGPTSCGQPSSDATLFGRGSGVDVPDEAPHCYGKNWDGNDVHLKACTTFNVKKRDAGRTWWSQKSFLTFWSNDGQHGDSGCFDCDNINRVSGYVKYDNARVSEWAPSVTFTPASGCTSHDVTITTNGVSTTQSQKRCTERFAPWALGTLSSGARWTDDDGAAVGVFRSDHHQHIASTQHSNTRFDWQAYVRWD